MKVLALIVLSFAFFSPGAFAKSCRNFSGTFEMLGTNNPVRLTTTQDRCKTLNLDYNFYVSGQKYGKVYLLDGVLRATFENADMIVYESAKTVGDQIVATVQDAFKKPKIIKSAAVYFRLDGNRDLSMQVDYIDENGVITKTKTTQFKRL